MPFTYDIFISYGQLDDEDPAGDLKGWVDLLTERLPRLVSNNLGYKPKLWRDQVSLGGNQPLRAALEEGVSHSLLFVPIFSPRYVQSQWCRFELDTFCSAQPPPGVPAHLSRIFKVIKTPLLPHLSDKDPEQLRELIGYSFYEMEGNMPAEFSPDVVPSKDQRYWNALRRLAWDISNMLVDLKHKPVPPGSGGETNVAATPANAPVNTSRDAALDSQADPPPSPPIAGKVVYLAETTSDLTDERELVRDELRQRGHLVLPEKKLPLEEVKKTEAVVRADLERCALSVHLVGARYGSSPEDDARSVVRIQEELAAEHGASKPAFLRLLWMPPGLSTPALEISDERQKSFIAELQTGVGAGAELLQTSVDDLKTRIVEKLSPPVKAATRGGRHSKLKKVYLICEERDHDLVRPIEDYLFSEKIEVIPWLGQSGNETLMEYHRKNLRECDAALVYFGSGDVPWADKNLDDLEKAYGYGREQDWVANAIYVGPPDSQQKERFRSIRTEFFIRNFKAVDPSELHDFVSAVKAAEGAQQ